MSIAFASIENKFEPFRRSAESIWTDPYIGGNMVKEHLDESSDAASRRPATIDATVAWLVRDLPQGARILDLGCGPGLYAERLAAAGFRVTGLDYNPASIATARRRAEAAGLDIDYRQGDYLSAELGEGYDLAMMIYCDFGALVPDEQAALLRRLRSALAPGGRFAFDVFGPGLARTKREGKDWYASKGADFWSPQPYLLCEETRLFPELGAIGNRYLLVESAAGTCREFIIWDQYYDDGSLARLLEAQGYSLAETVRDIVPPGDFASNDVVFAIATP